MHCHLPVIRMCILVFLSHSCFSVNIFVNVPVVNVLQLVIYSSCQCVQVVNVFQLSMCSSCQCVPVVNVFQLSMCSSYQCASCQSVPAVWLLQLSVSLLYRCPSCLFQFECPSCLGTDLHNCNRTWYTCGCGYEHSVNYDCSCDREFFSVTAVTVVRSITGLQLQVSLILPYISAKMIMHWNTVGWICYFLTDT